MSLLSYDAILAALDAGAGQSIQWGKNTITTTAGFPWSLWFASGSPNTGVVTGAALTSAQASKTTGGAMPFTNAGGSDQLRLVSMSAMSNVGTLGILMLVDRLLYYPGITVGATSPIALTNSTTIPRYTTGAGTAVFLEVSANLTQSAGSFTMSYTNQAGTAGRTSESASYTANAIQGRLQHNHGLFAGLQNDDTGIRSVESITYTTTSSGGSMALVICKPLATIPLYTANAAVERDLVLNTPRFPEIKDDACLQWLLWAGNSSTGALAGDLFLVAG